ncbi:hypothetical protein GQ54DRAFT_301063, partial [Martensiomyces pterosporus]
ILVTSIWMKAATECIGCLLPYSSACVEQLRDAYTQTCRVCANKTSTPSGLSFLLITSTIDRPQSANAETHFVKETRITVDSVEGCLDETSTAP